MCTAQRNMVFRNRRMPAVQPQQTRASPAQAATKLRPKQELKGDEATGV